MDKKNKIILITISILVVIVLVFVFSMMFFGKNKELNNSNIQNVVVEDLKNATGKIVSVEISQIKIKNIAGENMSFKIPEKDVAFYRQFQQEENEFLNEEIGLFDIKEGDEVQIQYDNKTNEALLITVKE
jgi:amino acid permease